MKVGWQQFAGHYCQKIGNRSVQGQQVADEYEEAEDLYAQGAVGGEC